MMRFMGLPGLLDAGPIDNSVLAVRDGPVNFFVVKGPEGLVCMDAGWRRGRIGAGFEELGLRMEDVVAIFLTHMHWDHARGAYHFPNARIYSIRQLHAGTFGKKTELPRPWTEVSDGQNITAAGLNVAVIGTPGHTADSLSYVIDNRLLFTGDALLLRKGEAFLLSPRFNRDNEAARRSIRRLATLSGIERLLTAHTGISDDVTLAFRRWRGSDERNPA